MLAAGPGVVLGVPPRSWPEPPLLSCASQARGPPGPSGLPPLAPLSDPPPWRGRREVPALVPAQVPARSLQPCRHPPLAPWPLPSVRRRRQRLLRWP